MNLSKDITNSDVCIYDYLGGRIEKKNFLKPVDEKQVINTVKACTKNFAQILKT